MHTFAAKQRHDPQQYYLAICVGQNWIIFGIDDIFAYAFLLSPTTPTHGISSKCRIYSTCTYKVLITIVNQPIADAAFLLPPSASVIATGIRNESSSSHLMQTEEQKEWQ